MSKRIREDKKPLHELWTELNPKPKVPQIEEIQEYVYNEIEKVMIKKERKCSIPVTNLYSYTNDIQKWLEEIHKISSKIENVNGGYNPSTHDSFIIKSLVVYW